MLLNIKVKKIQMNKKILYLIYLCNIDEENKKNILMATFTKCVCVAIFYSFKEKLKKYKKDVANQKVLLYNGLGSISSNYWL